MSKFSDEQLFKQILQGLFAENPLGAREKPADAYELCWCGSGKKWKFCHKNRHNEKPLTHGEHSTLVKKARQDWVENSHICLHPLAAESTCSPKVTNSHTVQRSRGLLAIAEENHVLSTKKALQSLEKNGGDIVPARIGLKDASTFPGFCNAHDTSMFLPVERSVVNLNEESAFLLSFRAVAYEYVMKQYNVVSHAIQRDTMDRGRHYADQVAIQSWLDGTATGTRMALTDMKRWKEKYDAAFNGCDYSDFNAYMVAFDSILPFVGAGAFMPEFDFAGSRLQTVGVRAGLEHLAVNVTVLNGVSVAVFGWWSEPGNAATRFVGSFAAIPDDEKATALATCIFEHLENVYYRQSWWESLSEREKLALDDLTRGGVIIRSPSSLSDRSLRMNIGVSEIFNLRRN